MRSPDIRTCIDIVDYLLIEASVTKEPVLRAGLFAMARQKSIDCLDDAPEDPDLNYLVGLTLYDSFCDDEQYGPQAEDYLRKAVSLDPSNQYARLYLGHYCYDTKRFEEALDCFQAVDENYFRSIPQVWRVLTLHELIICCRVFLDDNSLSLRDFERLVEEFLHTELTDVPIPWEIVECLAATKSSVVWNVVDRREVQRLVTTMIDGIDLSEEFKERARPALT
jgi:tetratricopeptide (TPR) repeat protein